ncbi:hypothetical protein [Sinomonas albida]|uniref:hypothetical protein n=1 Tax=Sinomonas albida TaxID=369942 RepID=UPI0030175CE1
MTITRVATPGDIPRPKNVQAIGVAEARERGEHLGEYLEKLGRPYHVKSEYRRRALEDSAAVTAVTSVLHGRDGGEEPGVALFASNPRHPLAVLSIEGAERLAERLDAVLEAQYNSAPKENEPHE